CTVEPRYFIWACAATLILAWAIRYFDDPSFWLDEAFIAVSIRERSISSLFAQLEYGQHFPRIYLASIATLRDIFGYKTQVLRFVPSLCFIAGTLLWARLLVKRARTSIPPCLIAGSLLIGSTYWMDQAVQLKQYSFDVLLSIIPFILPDDFFNRTLGDGKDKKLLPLLAIGCFVSYSYPVALMARSVGWYLYRLRRQERSLNIRAVASLVLPVSMGMVTIWATDYRFNLLTRGSIESYWKNCILASRLSEGAISAMKLTADFIWGWHHGRLMPLVVVAVIPLQIAGVYWAVKRWVSGELDENEKRWGSRTLGSLVLLISVVFSSAIISYPICAGRLTLFAQVHTQILIIEGALFFSSRPGLKRGGSFCLLPPLSSCSIRSTGTEISYCPSRLITSARCWALSGLRSQTPCGSIRVR
ncbi:MAG TPA: hypothetical protein VFQ92_10695, partial [Blastocatellia bacterium]|nr:hypothetical protein [Blastocatellia bacterium]